MSFVPASGLVQPVSRRKVGKDDLPSAQQLLETLGLGIVTQKQQFRELSKHPQQVAVVGTHI